MALTYTQNWDLSLAGWTIGSYLVRLSTGYSTPYALELSTAPASIKVFATYNTQDSSDGNVSAFCKVRFFPSDTAVGTWTAGVAARGTGSPLDDATTSFYWAALSFRPKFGDHRFLIYRTTNGVTTTLADLQVFDLLAHNWYDIELRVSGSVNPKLSAMCRRVSDGYWLDSTGNWQATHSIPIQATDSSVSQIAGSGYLGVVYQSSSGGHIRTDDFSVSPMLVVSDTLSLTPAASIANDLIAVASANIGLQASPVARKDISKSVAVNVGLSPAPANVANQFTAAVAVPINIAVSPTEETLKNAAVTTVVSLATSVSEVRDAKGVVPTAISIAGSPSAIADHVAAVAVPINVSASATGANNAAEFPAGVISTIGLVPAPAVAKATGSVSVVDTIGLLDLPSRYSSPLSASVDDLIRVSSAASASGIKTYSVIVGDTISIVPSLSQVRIGSYPVSISDSIDIGVAISHGVQGSWNVNLADTIAFSPSSASSGSFLVSAAAVDSISFRAVATAGPMKIFSVSTLDAIRIYDTVADARDARATVVTGISLSTDAAEAGHTARASTQTISFADSVRAGREISAGVLESLALTTPPEPPVGHPLASALSSIAISVYPDAIPGVKGAVDPDTIGFSSSVSAVAEAAGSNLLPILGGLDTEWPLSFTETPEGDIVMANGIDRMVIARCLPGYAEFVGVEPPVTGPMLGGVDTGVITGRRAAFVRFIDSDGNPSALSPVSNIVDCGWERPIDDLQISSTGAVAVSVPGHGLETGTEIVVRDVSGVESANKKLLVQRLDDELIGLNGVNASSSSQWHGGGSIVYGIKTILYSGVPTPTEAKVARRQILRNLEGSFGVLYVDIDTDDLSSTTFQSDRLDDSLRQQEAVAIEGPDGRPMESRHSLPPANKPVVASYAGRIWAAGEAGYSTGCVMLTQGSSEVRGVATNWKRSLAGRVLYINGARQAYGIASVDEQAQRITLDANASDTNLPRFCLYSIRSAPIDRRVIRYSDPGDPSVWPSGNSIALPEGGDNVVGLARHGQALCVVCERKIYRIVASRSEPAKDASLFLMAYRGSVNNRCIVEAEGHLWMLDEQGVHRYDGSETTTPVSDDIQNLFRQDGVSDFPQINWSSKDRRLWHGCLDRTRSTLRWFVDFIGKETLTHAIAYNYRNESWWIEQYPFRVSSSGEGVLGNQSAVAGIELRRIVCLGAGQTDIATPGTGTLQGTAESATSVSITDSTAVFPDTIAGSPFAIIDGPGKGQSGIIVSNTSTSFEWRDALSPVPQAGSQYVIGGIAWQWISGWLDAAEEEQDTARDMSISYEPHSDPSYIDVRIHRDHKSVAEQWARTVEMDGVYSENGSPDLRFDMRANLASQGYRTLRLAAHSEKNSYGDRHVQIRMSGVQPAEQTRIYRVDLSGIEFNKDEDKQ